MPQGVLYIVSAPSGAGKTSLLKAVREQLPQLKVAISHTTRAPRPGEINTQHYFFVSEDEFKKMQVAGDFLEHAQVLGNFYGTSKQAVNSQLALGEQVVLEIDWQGAQQVREIYSHALSIFILPPSIEALEQRLRARGQDSDEVIKGRMAQACSEISHYDEYQYLIINDNLDEAIQALANLFMQPIQYTAPDDHKIQALLKASDIELDI